MKKGRRQDGQLYVAASGTIRLKYWATVTENGVESRKRKDVFLCAQDEKHTATKTADGVKFSNAVLDLQDTFMLAANKTAAVAAKPVARLSDRTIAGFYENVYLPSLHGELKPCTIKTYHMNWKTHLAAHFGTRTLLEYTTADASAYLTSLASRTGNDALTGCSIGHIRTVAYNIFKRALSKGYILSNPWVDAASEKKYKKSKGTDAYTLEETLKIIDTFKHSQPSWVALIGLCFYGAMRPSEAVALQKADFIVHEGNPFVKISRGFVEGHLDATKTEGSATTIPIARQLSELLKAWKPKPTTDGWLFPDESGKKPFDLHNLYQKKMKAAFIDAGFAWYGLYGFRRGVATVINTSGNVLAAQSLLRHKNPHTTENYYAKFTAGQKQEAVKLLEAATK